MKVIDNLDFYITDTSLDGDGELEDFEVTSLEGEE